MTVSLFKKYNNFIQSIMLGCLRGHHVPLSKSLKIGQRDFAILPSMLVQRSLNSVQVNYPVVLVI